jgi:hypothetical protein
MIARERLGRKQLVSNRRTTPEYGGKEINLYRTKVTFAVTQVKV